MSHKQAAGMASASKRLPLAGWLPVLLLAQLVPVWGQADEPGLGLERTSWQWERDRFVPNELDNQDFSLVSSSAGGPTRNQAGERAKCSRQSIILARQALANELDSINALGPIWLHDLDRDELLASQRALMADTLLLEATSGEPAAAGQNRPLLELEASYFRNSGAANLEGQQHNGRQPASLRLMRKHQDRCHLAGGHFLYTFGLSLGPIEHSLDLTYNMPRELQLGQPISWRPAQVRLLVPKIYYEVSLRQPTGGSERAPPRGPQQQPEAALACPEVQLMDVTQMAGPPNKSQISISTLGLALTNQTSQQLDQLFSHYTRPQLVQRLRQALKFHLNAKSLPLAAPSSVSA